MPIFNLNTLQSQLTTVGITEDIISSGVRSTVAVTTTSSVILPSNSSRGYYQVYNNGSNTCFLAHSSSVSVSNFEFPLPAGNLWYPDISNGRYLGQVSAITASGTTSLQVTEFTII